MVCCRLKSRGNIFFFPKGRAIVSSPAAGREASEFLRGRADTATYTWQRHAGNPRPSEIRIQPANYDE